MSVSANQSFSKEPVAEPNAAQDGDYPADLQRFINRLAPLAPLENQGEINRLSTTTEETRVAIITRAQNFLDKYSFFRLTISFDPNRA